MTDRAAASSLRAQDPTGAPRGPVAAAFIVLGMFWGSWAVVIADVQQAFGLSDATLGLLLAVAIGLAAVTGAYVGHRAERWGTRRMLSGSLLAWAVLLVRRGSPARGPCSPSASPAPRWRADASTPP